MKKLSVLVVDDSKVQRNHVIDMCKNYGMQIVIGATDGEDAIDKLTSCSFDLVFIDLEMPIMDGVELVRQIAKKDLAKSVIILSSKDPALILSVGTMAEADGLTVLGTFKKPMTRLYLDASLKRIETKNKQTKNNIFNTDLGTDDLLNAIKNKEISLVYQPKITSKGFLLKGVEALARWHHPTLGNVTPDEFINIAERFGLISELTEHIFDLAFKQKKYWKEHGINCELSVNLSPLSLADKNLANWISDHALQYQITPKEITLEVTENAISGDIPSAIETLAKLRLKGFNLSIDDYGTGFANAQQLARVPATELKLDRSLIDHVATRPQQQAIVRSTINLAKELHLSTVAEGVEDLSDFVFLRDLEVDLVQGYYFAKPMTPDLLANWLNYDLAVIRKQFLSNSA
jgi:EAL domain-containing protein (putative c-di-GMP-specific phosphodiesterase class I)/CheY-like chemotaxis protein